MRRAVGTAALGAARVVDGVSTPSSAPRRRAKTGARACSRTAPPLRLLPVPVTVVVLVAILFLGGRHRPDEFDLCYTEVNKAAELARGIAPRRLARHAGRMERRAAGGRPAANNCAPTTRSWRCYNEAQNVIDALLIIERRPTTVIDALPSATLADAVLQTDDLYVLNNANDQVYRLTLTPDGDAVVPGSRQPIQAMRRSRRSVHDGRPDRHRLGVGRRGQKKQDSVITASDANGVLVDCPPRFLQEKLRRAANQHQRLGQPHLYRLLAGHLYVSTRRQSGVALRPERPAGILCAQPDVGHLGSRFRGHRHSRRALHPVSDGAIIKFPGGRHQPFAYSISRSAADDGHRHVFSTPPTDLMMYITSRDARTVYQTTHAGTFAASYRRKTTTCSPRSTTRSLTPTAT